VRVVADIPGRLLEVEGTAEPSDRGRPWVWFLPALAFLLLISLPVAGIAFGLLWVTFAAIASFGDVHSAALVSNWLPWTIVGTAELAFLVWSMRPRGSSTPETLRVDRDSGRATIAGFDSVPFDRLERIVVKPDLSTVGLVPVDGSPLWIALGDSSSQALVGLACSIGRVAGFHGLRFVADDPAIEVVKEVTNGALPLPAAGEPLPAFGFATRAAPGPPPPPIDPRKWPISSDERIDAWQPGTTVRTSGKLSVAGLALVSAPLLFVVAILWRTGRFESFAALGTVGVVGLALGVVVTVAFVLAVTAPRRTTIDWSSREVRFVADRRGEAAIPFSAIVCVQARTRRHYHKRKGGSGYPMFWSDVRIVLDDGRTARVSATRSSSDRAEVEAPAAAMAAELGHALGTRHVLLDVAR
jgi:hypothetical protein